MVPESGDLERAGTTPRVADSDPTSLARPPEPPVPEGWPSRRNLPRPRAAEDRRVGHRIGDGEWIGRVIQAIEQLQAAALRRAAGASPWPPLHPHLRVPW